jgi:hypothetical protein
MRLLCPFCQKAITMPDSEAGKAVHCPECGQQFAAPQLYTPAPAPLPPTVAASPVATQMQFNPPPVPETYVHEQPPEPAPAELPEVPKPDRELSGFGRMRSVPLDPRVIRWLPAGALFLALVLTLFPWDGLYPAGYPAFTQNAWGAMVGSMTRDQVADDELRVAGPESPKVGDELDRRLTMSWWLLPYLLLLLPTVALAIAGPIVDLAKLKLPPPLDQAWQFRPALLAVLTMITLLFLLAQWATGLGLQRAVNDKIDADFTDSRAAANTPEKLQRWEMKVAMAKGAYHVTTTPWLRLTVLMHLLAAGAVLTEAGLMLRGTKPPPRVGVMW